MRCSGPYTRVFLDRKDASRCRRFVERLQQAGLRVIDSRVPAGGSGLDDFACDITVEETANSGAGRRWQLSVARFLGPRKRFRQGRIYEIVLRRPDDGWQAHLFDARLARLMDRLLVAWPRLAADLPVDGLIAKADAHEMRIELCVGL